MKNGLLSKGITLSQNDFDTIVQTFDKDKNGKLSFLTKPKNYKMLFPRQNRSDSFKFTGGAYLRKSKNILNYQGDGWALGNNPYGVVVSDEEALDINYREDLLKIQHSWKR